ncbi:MAG: acetyl-CoA decarbonylase/synthase complex subunit gamma [Thermoplasmata archaeon]|nr:MAG: acetyl-CoA decarbonylase/synthase complex subunit gamma [Thermoplasmata archaeon]
MALTAIEIFKFLPKTNCGKCGVPTCLAFAMKIANKQAELSACPDVSEDAMATLAESSAPPQRLVTIGADDNKIELGNETELFRHEKKFFHQTAFSLLIEDTESDDDIQKKLKEAADLKVERIGQILEVDMIALKGSSGDPAKFEALVNTVKGATSKPLMLIGDNVDVLGAGLKVCGSNRPLIYSANASNWEDLAKLAKEHSAPLAVTGATLTELADLTQKIKGAGVEDMVVGLNYNSYGEALQRLTILRRLVVKKTFRPLGYPIVMMPREGVDSVIEGVQTAIAVMKYGGIAVLKDIEAWKMFPLFTLRQNIYTDPQIPLQVQEGLYEINNPTEDSPLMFTTNFSLTYFTVQGDVEGSKIPSYIIVINTEGLSVMTAFAADKLTADDVVKVLDSSGVKDKIKHKKLIIPGMVARMSGKLNELSGFDIDVGPRESSGLPKFLKAWSA